MAELDDFPTVEEDFPELPPDDEDDFPGHYRRISLEAWCLLVELYGLTEPACAVAVCGTPYHDLKRWRVFHGDPTAIDASILPPGDGKHFKKDEPENPDKYVPGKYLKKGANALMGFLGMGPPVAGGGKK